MVSVIIPAYNSEPWISKAIGSVLAQEGLSELEIIVIDDASSDQTVQIARSFEGTGKVKVLCQSVNGGVAAARNRGLDAAQGEYIALLDSDDWIEPTRFARLVKVADTTGADLVADPLFYVRNTTVVRTYPTPWFSEDHTTVTATEFVRRDLGPTKPLIRTAFLKSHRLRYDESLRSIEDFDFALRLMLFGARFVMVRQPGYYRLLRQESLSRDIELGRTSVVLVVNRFLVQPGVRKDTKLVVALEDFRSKALRIGPRTTSGRGIKRLMRTILRAWRLLKGGS